MSRCAYQYAEDGGNDQVAVTDASGQVTSGSPADDLPAPASAGLADFTGLFRPDTVAALNQEAGSGAGAQVFAAGQGQGKSGLLWLLGLGGLIYFATR